MTRAMRHGTLSIRSAPSASSTPALLTPSSSAYPSAYPSEDEDGGKKKSGKSRTFPFLSLPSEIRNHIYSMVFASAPPVIDLDPTTFSILHRHKLLTLFSVSRQIHSEAAHHFFSTHTFRLFPTYPGRYFKTKKPLLARLPKHYRASLTNLELRLGPGWNNPPRGWVVNDALGLVDCTNVRVLKVFVECDPSNGIFKGFRAGDGFYEKFSQNLLEGVLKGTPSVQVVELDAYKSVERDGDMIAGLLEVVTKFEKVVGWGPDREWEKDNLHIWLDAILMPGVGHENIIRDRKVAKTVAITA